MKELAWSVSGLAFWTSIVVMPVAVILSFYNWRLHGYKLSHGILEIFRVALIGVVLLLLWQPEITEEMENAKEPKLVIISDFSKSMETRDVEKKANSPGSQTLQRSVIRDQLLETNRWSTISSKYKLIFEEFGGAKENLPSQSNLYTPIKSSLDSNPGLKGIVVISDGDWNSGPAPSQLASALRLAKVPVLVLPVGSNERLPDIRISDVAIPGYGIAGKSLRIPVSLRSSFAKSVMTPVKLTFSNGEVLEKSVVIPALNKAEVAFDWKPPVSGNYSLKVDIVVPDNDAVPENNTFSADFQVRQESIKVLVVDTLPRWEYRYLRNALSRDPGIDLSCLLFHPGLSKRGGGDEDYIQEFPQNLNELSGFDVIILGDVGLAGDQLSSENCRMIRGIVENQASGLILIPGMDGNQLSLIDSDLEPLIPIQFDISQPFGWGSRDPENFSLTREGRRSLLTRLGDSEEENLSIWEELPGFNWYAPVARSKVGTQVLATHQLVGNDYGLIPLLVTKTQGQGKVLFLGTDSAWRWREGVEDQFHYRFWGQVIRWMAYQRNMAEGQSLRLIHYPERPEVQKPVKLHVTAMNNEGEPLEGGDIRIRFNSPSGKTSSTRMQEESSEWGLYQADWTPEEAGNHRLIVESETTGENFVYEISISGLPLEIVGEPARTDVLEELARLSGGKVLDPVHFTQASDLISLLPDNDPIIRRIPLWSHPWTLILVVLLFTIFWVLRKRIGLV